jgi:hypothetical protein
MRRTPAVQRFGYSKLLRRIGGPGRPGPRNFTRSKRLPLSGLISIVHLARPLVRAFQKQRPARGLRMWIARGSRHFLLADAARTVRTL